MSTPPAAGLLILRVAVAVQLEVLQQAAFGCVGKAVAFGDNVNTANP